jgi:hypothetical protein
MIRSRRRVRSIFTALVVVAAWGIVRAKATERALARLQAIEAAELQVAAASGPVVERPRDARASETNNLRAFFAPSDHGRSPAQTEVRRHPRFTPHDGVPVARRTRSYDATAPPTPPATRG